MKNGGKNSAAFIILFSMCIDGKMKTCEDCVQYQ